MFLMYVDESGDAGIERSPSRYYILSGIVVHELRWLAYLEQFANFRRRMKTMYGLHLDEEIHAYEMMNKPGDMSRIAKYNRLAILRNLLDELALMSAFNVINVVVDKQNKPMDYDVFAHSWSALLQQFENAMGNKNFRGPSNADERGMVFSDVTDGGKLRQIMRQMRRYDPVPSQPQFGFGYRNLLIKNIIEDPSFRQSDHSYFIQAADVIAYFLKQRLISSSYIKRKYAHNYFSRLLPILYTDVAQSNSQGIVFL